MGSFRVDGAEITALGGRLTALAAEVAAQGDVGLDRWAFGPGCAGAAFEDLVAGWRHQRLQLCRALDELGSAATQAGGLYLDAEALAGRWLLGGPT